MIKRDLYLNRLIKYIFNGRIKIITGVRRSGKSYLLFNIFHDYLVQNGIKEENILCLKLEENKYARYRNPIELDNYVRSYTNNSNEKYFVFIDEIQFVQSIPNPYLSTDTIGFVDVVLGLMSEHNMDVYITGSNSRMLSSDILTQFRDRGDEIKVFPLSFKEFYDYTTEKENAWQNYFTYGGMPYITQLSTRKEKSDYLNSLFENTYIKDVIERNNLKKDKGFLDELLNVISSSVGSLTNPNRLSNTFKSAEKENIGPNIITKYLDYLTDAFLIEKAYRYDIKGRKYINTPLKYYFVDVGLRNSRLNFRQQEENHIMENIIYNELKLRGFNVDVGVVEQKYKNADGKYGRNYLEVDFIASDGNNTYYIQSALNVATTEKYRQEINSLIKIPNAFKRIVIVKDKIIPWYDENGIYFIGIEDFLLNNEM